METIGRAIAAVAAKAAAGVGLQPTLSIKPVLPAKRDANGLPSIADEECDIAIPRRVLSAWIPDGGQRAVIRALTAKERALVEGRAGALRDALRPFAPTEQGRVNAEIAAMFNGFRSMRQQDEDVTATVEVTRRVLREFPLWAISRGCLLIAQKKADLDPKWPPNDSQIYGVVEEIVRYFRARLVAADGLLSAPVESPDPPRPTAEEIAARLGREVGPLASKPKRRDPFEGDGKHAQRVMADIEARRARRVLEATGS